MSIVLGLLDTLSCVYIYIYIYIHTYIYSTNIPPIMIINRIYETQNLLSLVACFLPGRAKDLLAPLCIAYLVYVLLLAL